MKSNRCLTCHLKKSVQCTSKSCKMGECPGFAACPARQTEPVRCYASLHRSAWKAIPKVSDVLSRSSALVMCKERTFYLSPPFLGPLFSLQPPKIKAAPPSAQVGQAGAAAGAQYGSGTRPMTVADGSKEEFAKQRALVRFK